MALALAAELAPVSEEGFRLGSLVEVCGPVQGLPGEEAAGKLGQLVDYSDEEGVFQVCLTTGSTCQAPPGSLKAPADLQRPGLGGGPNSFDLFVGPRLQEGLLGEEIAACLFEKGFCVLKTSLRPDQLKSATDDMKLRGETGRLHRLPEEVEEGYLGTNGKGKVAWLDPASSAAPKEEALQQGDAFISTLASAVQPYCSDMLGKFVTERTPALASLSLLDEEEDEYPPADADDQTLGDFLRMWRRSQIKIVHYMGPGTANVSLEVNDDTEEASALPRKQEFVEINGEPNTILIFRTGCFRYECRCETEVLTLSATLLEHTEALTLQDFTAADAAALMAGGSGPPGPDGKQVVVVNQATRLMCCWDEVEGYRAGIFGSCDGGVEIPILRWDVNLYYNPDDATRQPGQAFLKHQSYVEGLELFDNKYFEVTANDARVMDPMQRHVLEVGAQNLFKLGITKKDSNRTPHHAGCSVGLDKDDWDRQAADLFGMQGGTNVQAIISNRFSFIFNLRGPNYVADTACSASLAATHMATFALKDQEIEKLEFHVALGIHQCFLPWGLENFGPKMQWERCYTFNDTAQGYMRGDGCSGITLKYGGEELDKEKDCVWRASRVGQNGRSATMTAPNGIAQEEVIMKAVREAKIRPPESCIWNCHGTGTSLGDPIEVGGVRRVQIREEREHPLIVCTNKTHTGHLEGGAAMTSVIAAILEVKAMHSAPILHFRRLNPNMDINFNFIITNEVVSSKYENNNIHISSFGFGGTNCHAILWGSAQSDIINPEAVVLAKIRKMAPPEVRVNGDDPAMWEWDGPDETVKPGDKYMLSLDGDSALRWTKEEEGEEPDDGEEDFYCITGPFNDWEADRMEDGAVPGLRTITVEGPSSGSLQFRFLKNGEEDQILYPEYDECTRKTAAVLGPVQEDNGREKNTWYVACPEGKSVQIDLFICRGRRSVMWMLV